MQQPIIGRAIEEDVAALVAAAKAGDQEALGRLSEVYREYLLHIAANALGNDLRAKIGASDLVQEALISFRTTIAQLRGGSDADLRAYMRQILLNRVANAGRRFRQAGKREVGLEISLDGGAGLNGSGSGAAARQLVDRELTPGTRAIANERSEQVRAALSRLPQDYRSVIELRDLQDKPWEEVGVALGRSADAARQLWYRAIEELRQICEREDGIAPS